MMKKNRKSLFIVSTLLLSIILLSRCINKTEAFNDERGRSYAGSASCRQCHQAIYDSVLLSAHFNATAPASRKNIHGKFTAGQNEFAYDTDTKVVMENRDSGFYQVLYIKGKETAAHRFDITFGLRNAQTWLYWDNGGTYELPVSYYTSVHEWATSPGFSSTHPDFKRLIGRDCFECHSSNIKTVINTSLTAEIPETLVRSSLINGIDCERCHGPSANHVNYHLENPGSKNAMYIVAISKLSKQQKLDMCALCHSGNDKRKIESRFNFRPGDTLANFFLENANTTNNFDVHGNQFRLMSESKCFTGSNTMNCSTCHDPHKDATSNLSFYSQKCMGCHSEASHNFCPKADSLGISIKNNCIDCHMPKKPSEAISFKLAGSTEKSSYLLRTHRIAVYNNETTPVKADPVNK